jgi:protein-disulfide isomerase
MVREMQVLKANKLKLLLGAIASCVLVAAIVVATGSGKPTAGRRPVIPREPNAAQRTYALLAGIPQHGALLGYPKAPVTLQFFADLQCRESRQVVLGALPYLIRHWVRAGKLQIRFRSMETDTKAAGGWFEFREQQAAALAAGKQGKLWSFVDVFYRDQGPEGVRYVDEEFLDQIASQAGVEMPRWEEDRDPEAWYGRVRADEKLAGIRRLESTPSFLIGRTGGPAKQLRHFALEEPGVFDEAIEGLL